MLQNMIERTKAGWTISRNETLTIDQYKKALQRSLRKRNLPEKVIDKIIEEAL